MKESPWTTPAAPSRSTPHPLLTWLDGLTDSRLILLVAAVLFALAAWPLLLVQLPPFQDLPNHVATAHIVAHPDLYPQFVFNGLFKSNCLLTLWFYLLGGHGLFGAARVFTALVLAANALALPLFVLHFAGRRALPVATLFVWPLVHSFTVSMGFLNFTIAFALSLILLTVLDRQRERPTLVRGLGITALSGVVWYAHPFPLAVRGRDWSPCTSPRAPRGGQRIAAGVALLLPLVPAGLLSLVSAQQHLIKAEHSSAAAASFMYLNPWEIVEPPLARRLRRVHAVGEHDHRPDAPAPLLCLGAAPSAASLLLDGGDGACLAVAYVGLPHMMSNWFYLNTPFGSVLVGWPRIAAPNHAAAARRDPAGRLRALVLSRTGRRLCEAGPRHG